MAKENRKASLREEFDSLQAERRARYLENLLKEAILNVLAEQQQTPKPPPTDPNDPNALPPVPPPPAAPGAVPPPAAPPPPAADPAAAMPPAPVPDPNAAPAPMAPPAPADPGMGAAPLAQPNAKETSVTALVDSLNVIRGGKSLTDPEVMGGISTVFKSLTAEQKQELTGMLDMLSKAVAGTEDQAAETQGVPAPTMTPPPPPAPPAPAQAPPPISPTGI